ncbi:MAG TPA: PIN domain-containing protein [Roseiarcus sp.]|nr:PIN domain-containing protein [Roseiarcus sp.]
MSESRLANACMDGVVVSLTSSGTIAEASKGPAARSPRRQRTWDRFSAQAAADTRLILVDTSVWIDHLRAGNALLANLLDAGRVLTHSFVIGELALARMRQREVILAALSDLPRAESATDAEVLGFVDREALFGRGVGYVDVHLLASVRLTPGAEIWTRDNRLRHVAEELGLAMASHRSPTP